MESTQLTLLKYIRTNVKDNEINLDELRKAYKHLTEPSFKKRLTRLIRLGHIEMVGPVNL